MQTERRGKRYSPIRVPFRRVSHLRSRGKCLYTSLVTVSEKTDVGSIYDPQTGRKISIQSTTRLCFLSARIKGNVTRVSFPTIFLEQATIFFLISNSLFLNKFPNNNIVNLEIDETN